MDDKSRVDEKLRHYLYEDEEPRTPVASGGRMYVLGRLIAIVERAEGLLLDVGPEGIDDPFVRLKLLRGIARIRELLADVERHLASRPLNRP
jgi:hypothetical protein